MSFDLAPVVTLQILTRVEDAPISDCVTVVICSFLISMVLQFLLQRETNWTSALFRAGCIAPRIRSITDRHLLLPMSQSHIALGASYDALTRYREQYEVSTFHCGNMCEVRRLLSTGKLLNCVDWTEQPANSLVFAVLAQVFQLFFSLVTYDGLYADSHLFAMLTI